MNTYHDFLFWTLHPEFGHPALKGIKRPCYSVFLKQNQEETVTFSNKSKNDKSINATVATLPGDFVTELRVSGFRISRAVFGNMP